MPYAYRKIRNQNAYRVFNKITGVIHSNHTTLDNAKKQIKLLNAIENNPDFKPRKVGKGGSEYGTDDELVEIDENRIRRQERQRTTDSKTQLQIDRLNALRSIPNPTEADKISIGFLEKQIRKALIARGGEGYAISPDPIIEPSQPKKKPRSGSGVKKVGTGDRTPPQTQPNLRTPTPPQPPPQPQRIIIPSNPQNPLQILLTPTRRRNRRGGVPVIPNIIPPLPATPEQQFIIQQPIQSQPQPARGVNLFGNPPATQPNQIESSSSSASSTPRQDDKRRRTGKGLPAGDIQKLLKNSYQIPPAETVGDFVLDKSLSGRRVQVYKNRNTPQAVVVHRGTQGVKDWATDLFYATGGDTTQTNRFKHAADIQKKAESKYGAKNITTLGHSLGAKISSTVGQNSKEIINLNKAVSPLDALQKTSSKEINIRTSGDPVSALLPIRNNERTITIPSKTYNPFTEHKTDTLNRLPANQIIGSGAAVSAIRQAFRGKPYVIQGLERIEPANTKEAIFLAVFAMMRRYTEEAETGTIPLGNNPFDILFDYLKREFRTEYDGGFYQEIAAEIINNRDIQAEDLKEVVEDWIYSIPEFQPPLLNTSAPTEAEVIGEPPIADATVQRGKGLTPEQVDAVIYTTPIGAILLKVLYEIYMDRPNPQQVAPQQQEETKDERDIEMGQGLGKRGVGIKRGGAIKPLIRTESITNILPLTRYSTPQEVFNTRRDIIQFFNDNVSDGMTINQFSYVNGFIREQLKRIVGSVNTGTFGINENTILNNRSREILDDISSIPQDTKGLMGFLFGNNPIELQKIGLLMPNKTVEGEYIISSIEYLLREYYDDTISPFIEYNIEHYNNEPDEDDEEILSQFPDTRPTKKQRINGGSLAKKISPPNKKMVGKTNPWVEYVKSFATGKGINYRSALKHPDISKGYKKGGMMREEMDKLIGFVDDPKDREIKKTIKEGIKSPYITAKQEDIVKCPYCKEYYKYKGLSRHIAQVHPGLPVEYQKYVAPSNRGLQPNRKQTKKEGKGMPTSKETVIAEAYNERELGANGGKMYVSL